MADKRISQLIERTDIANNDVLPIVASGATTTNKVTVSTLQDWMQDNLDVGVTSVGLSVPSAFSVSGSPVTTSGNITISGAGTTAQYIRGDGSLADFPSISGGGSSVSYYLNGSVSQGTIGGIAYREMNKTPILGAGTDITINADGYIASFITDAGDPNLLLIPAGNWNFETYFSASSGGGSPTFYVELYKVSAGGTATLIASNSGTPESISLGTNINPYFSALAVPSTTLALTDRLAIRYYVTHSGRTITLHTENGHLCQVITTFTTGLTALNGLTAQVQNFATGTSGTDFNISSASTTHTFNLPDASASNRGVVTTGTQTIAGIKTFTSTIRADVSVLLAQAGTALPTDLRNISGTGLTSSGSNGFGFNSGNNIYFSGSDKGGGIISFSNTGNRTYTLQNASGTLAFTSDLGAYLPLAGGTLTGALNGTSAVFSGDLQSGTRLIAAASSQSIILTPNSGGTTNRVESVGTLPLALVSAAAITMAAGGTTPQITLATTGAATFSGDVTISKNTAPSVFLTNTISGGINYRLLSADDGTFRIQRTGIADLLTLASTGAATFSSSVTTSGDFFISGASKSIVFNSAANFFTQIYETSGSLVLQTGNNPRLTLASTGAATFSSSVTAGGDVLLGFAANRRFGVDLNSGEYFYGISSNSNARQTRVISAAADGNLGISFETGNTYTTVTPKMTITSAGNVGIGTASPGQRLTVSGGYISQVDGGVSTFLGYDGTGSLVGTTTNHYLRFITNDTERMRITSAGNVGIGTASPASRLHVSGDILIPADGRLYGNSSTTTGSRSYIEPYNGSTGDMNLVTGFSTASIVFGTQQGTERMRITSGGNVCVNRSTSLLSSVFSIDQFGSASTNIALNHFYTGNKYIDFGWYGTSIGSITNISGTAVSFNTSSDYRLKEDLQEINGLEKIQDIKVYNYKWKGHDFRMDGVLAHELAEVLPYAVHGEKDEVDEEGNDKMQGVDYSKIVPVLIKAIQELKTEIDSLKNQIK